MYTRTTTLAGGHDVAHNLVWVGYNELEIGVVHSLLRNEVLSIDEQLTLEMPIHREALAAATELGAESLTPEHVAAFERPLDNLARALAQLAALRDRLHEGERALRLEETPVSEVVFEKRQLLRAAAAKKLELDVLEVAVSRVEAVRHAQAALVEPVLTDDALHHFTRSVASLVTATVLTDEVVVVDVLVLLRRRRLVLVQIASVIHAIVAAIATKTAFRIDVDHITFRSGVTLRPASTAEAGDYLHGRESHETINADLRSRFLRSKARGARAAGVDILTNMAEGVGTIFDLRRARAGFVLRKAGRLVDR